jgi:hypothetical protein
MSVISWPRETTVDSLSDRTNIDIEVRRRGNAYTLIARQFGVVVRSNDLKSGIEELDRRVAIIANDLLEVGIPVSADSIASAKSQQRTLDQVLSPLIIIVTVAAVLASFVLVATLPIVAALASVRSAISTLAPAEGGNGIAGLGHFGIDFIVKVSQTLEQVTPERKEELRSAVRKIAREVDLIIEDVKAAPAPSPQKPPNGDKR